MAQLSKSNVRGSSFSYDLIFSPNNLCSMKFMCAQFQSAWVSILIFMNKYLTVGIFFLGKNREIGREKNCEIGRGKIVKSDVAKCHPGANIHLSNELLIFMVSIRILAKSIPSITSRHVDFRSVMENFDERGSIQRWPGSGWPRALSEREKEELVDLTHDKTGVSQRKLAKKFKVDQKTISNTLKSVGVLYQKRIRAPKATPAQEKRQKLRLN